jgi:DNA-binding transcriptional MerR regulator
LISKYKEINKDESHVNILGRAEELSKSGQRVFDKNRLKSNEDSILKESKSLGLSYSDIQEVLKVSRAAPTAETSTINLSKQIKDIDMTLANYVEQQKQVIKFIEFHLKKSVESVQIDNTDMPPFLHSQRDMLESYNKILNNIFNNVAEVSTTASTLANMMLSINTKMFPHFKRNK